MGFYLSILYPLSAVILVCCLTKTVSAMLNNITYQLKNKITNENLTDARWKSLLTEWKQSYLMICQLIDKINFCFGPVLLIITICVVLYFFNLSFITIWIFTNSHPIDRISLTINAVTLSIISAHFSAIACSANHVRQQVNSQHDAWFLSTN